MSISLHNQVYEQSLNNQSLSCRIIKHSSDRITNHREERRMQMQDKHQAGYRVRQCDLSARKRSHRLFLLLSASSINGNSGNPNSIMCRVSSNGKKGIIQCNKLAVYFLYINSQVALRIIHRGTFLGRLQQLPLARDVVGFELRDNAARNLFESLSGQREDSWSCTR